MSSEASGPLPQDLFIAAETAHAAAEHAQSELLRVRRFYLAAEHAYIARVAAAQLAGQITWREVLTAYDQVREWATTSGCGGFSGRWREQIPLDRQTIRRYAEALPRGDDGSWSGHTGWEAMTDPSTYPPRGVHVAFVLFGNAGYPIAYGYTKHFRERTKRMWNGEGLRWLSWTALLARDTEDARAKRAELQARHGLPNVAAAGPSTILPNAEAPPAAHPDAAPQQPIEAEDVEWWPGPHFVKLVGEVYLAPVNPAEGSRCTAATKAGRRCSDSLEHSQASGWSWLEVPGGYVQGYDMDLNSGQPSPQSRRWLAQRCTRHEHNAVAAAEPEWRRFDPACDGDQVRTKEEVVQRYTRGGGGLPL